MRHPPQHAVAQPYAAAAAAAQHLCPVVGIEQHSEALPAVAQLQAVVLQGGWILVNSLLGKG